MNRNIFGVLLTLVIMPHASLAIAGITELSDADTISGLRLALTNGLAAAVKLLWRENGYFCNVKVKIPLPPALKKVESCLRIPATSTVTPHNSACSSATLECDCQLSSLDSRNRMSSGAGCSGVPIVPH